MHLRRRLVFGCFSLTMLRASCSSMEDKVPAEIALRAPDAPVEVRGEMRNTRPRWAIVFGSIPLIPKATSRYFRRIHPIAQVSLLCQSPQPICILVRPRHSYSSPKQKR